ncbi:protein ACCELERATED CELL DEATH 6 isoform X2 [Neltuma alba]|uniref:protein ACCELERATED CELL DEATH 6 isoform X2 n=1 Tax=Neltuma alba TaxID=207710 RepID=UPI0010A52130|nr:protein ACCELERATED CELL DEATH 6-like isoform X2 [Prosopis alba]
MESLKYRERKHTGLDPCEPSKSNHLKEEIGASKLMAPELFWAVKRRDVSDNASNFLTVLEDLASEEVMHVSNIIEQVTRGGNTILHLAVQNRSQEILRLTASHFPQLITRKNIAGDTALHLAARNKGKGLINVILTCYAEQRFSSGSQFHDDTEMNLLRIKNEIGNTALHEAVRTLHLEGARLLFEADKDVANYLNNEGKSPLYLAVETGHDDIIDLLLQAPLENRERHHGTSPLHAAIMAMSSVQISKHKFQPLVEGWVEDCATNFEACPAKAKMNYCEKILRKNSELVYLKDQRGGTTLHLAASRGNLEVVRTIFNACPLNALEWDLKGRLPIHIACKKGHVNLVKEFVEKPEPWFDPMDSMNQKGQNILHIAAKEGKDKVVKYILREKKLEKLLNMRDKNGNTPLHLASKYLHPKTLLLLTQEKRLNINLVNKEGMTARDIVMLRRRIPPTFREFLSFTILKSIGTPLSENGRRIRRSHTEPPQIGWIKDRVSTILLVAILVATVTFAAGFTMPGGVYGFDEKEAKKRGMATFLNKYMFQLFTICDVIAMYSSTMGSFILLWAQLGDFHMAFSATYFALYLEVMESCLGM